MGETTIKPQQQYCDDMGDHHTHNWAGRKSGYRTRLCPGRYTPRRHQAPHVSPTQPADPFANCDD